MGTALTQHLPSAEKVQYARNILELVLLLIAVPFVLRELFTEPGKLSERMAGHHALK